MRQFLTVDKKISKHKYLALDNLGRKKTVITEKSLTKGMQILLVNGNFAGIISFNVPKTVEV